MGGCSALPTSHPSRDSGDLVVPGAVYAEPKDVVLTHLEADHGPGEVMLGLVVPGSIAPEVAEIYRQSAFDNSAFQTHGIDFVSQWGVDSVSGRIHLFVRITRPPFVTLDLMMPTSKDFQDVLEAAYRRPSGAGIGVFLYDSLADAQRAPEALEAGDWALYNSLGVAVGQDLDMRPFGLVFDA